MLRWLKNIAKKSKLLTELYRRALWKRHLLIDWWGTKVWTKNTEVMTPFGFKLTSGLHPAYKLMRAGKFEVDETAMFLKLLPKVGRFVDIGANLGYYTCLALKGGTPVIAFEPQQQNLHCLFQNLAANGWSENAEIFPLALSEHPGLLTLYGASGPSASLVKDWAGYSSRFKKTVPVSTLDNVLAGRYQDERLFIKMDVEGAEFSVLKGATEILKRMPKPIWLLEVCLSEFHPAGKNPDFQSIFQLFFDNGYKAFSIGANPTLVSPSDIARWVHAGHSDSTVFNYLFVESENIIA